MTDTTGYRIPASEARAEIDVLRSRFIATLAPATTVDEAKAFIARIRAEFPDATHHVPAFLIGHGSSVVAHCHDDGEPPGTAGRPALAVLQGSGMGDVVVVVTRYFGGTKLGTGGLVRAYGDAVRAVLGVTTVVYKEPAYLLRLVVPYSLYDPVCQAVRACGGSIESSDFSVEVMLTALVRVSDLTDLRKALQELSAGRLEPEILEARRTRRP